MHNRMSMSRQEREKARRNDSLTSTCHQVSVGSRLAAAPPSRLRRGPSRTAGPSPTHPAADHEHQSTRRMPDQVEVTAMPPAAQIPVYQARRKRLSQVKVTATRETPRHNERCPRHRNDAWGTACLTVKHQRAKPSDTSPKSATAGPRAIHRGLSR